MKLSQNEAEQIAEIEKGCFAEPWSAASVNALLGREEAVFARSSDGKRLLGYALGAVSFDEAELYRLAVPPEFRRQGFGGRLLADFLQACFRRGARRVFLEVRSKNIPALSLYRKAGFAQIAVRKGYYGDDDAVVMEKEL